MWFHRPTEWLVATLDRLDFKTSLEPPYTQQWLYLRATLYTALPAAAPDDRTTEPRTGEPWTNESYHIITEKWLVCLKCLSVFFHLQSNTSMLFVEFVSFFSFYEFVPADPLYKLTVPVGCF